MDDLLRQAIESWFAIECRYRNYVRVLAPCELGRDPQGRDVLIGYQFGGGRQGGLPAGGEWVIFLVEEMRNVVRSARPFQTGREADRPRLPEEAGEGLQKFQTSIDTR